MTNIKIIRTTFIGLLVVLVLGILPLRAGTLLRNDFEANTWSAKSAYTNNASVTATVASGAYGTITTQGSSTPSQGLALTVNSSGASGAWTAGFTSGILSLTTTNGNITNLGLVTLSFSLSASQTRPIRVRLESYTAGNVRSGGLSKLIYPATTNYWQRFALDLSTMSPDGAGTFDPKSPQIAVSYELDSSAGGDGWPNAAGLTVKVDNVNYATPKYYVATNGSDSLAGTNEATAFATVNHAISLVVPGDIIVMRGGTYTNSVGFGTTGIGAPDAWIVLKNYPGETPVIRNNFWDVITIYISGSGTPSQYIELRGLTVRGYASFDANGDRFLDPNSTNGIGQAQGGPSCAAVYINGRDSVQVPHDFRIADSIFEYNAGGGPGGNSIDRLMIENTICRYNSWWTIYGTSGISTGENRDFDTSGQTRIVFQNNQTYGNETIVPCVSVPPTRFSDGNGIILDIPKNYTGGTLVQNNLSYNNGGSGIHGLTRNNFWIIHNTTYMNSASPVLQYGEIFVAYSTNVWMLNNILVAPTNTTGNSSFNEPITSNSGNLAGTIFFQSNLYVGGDIAIPVATGFSGNTQADPQFISPSIDPTNASFRLRSTSPARGNAPGLPYRSDIDYAGQPRPAGVSDQGAYQVQSTDCFPPMFAPLPGNFSSATNITLACGTAGATIIYTTNGTLPLVGSDGTITNGLTYAGAIPVSAAMTIQAVAWKSGLVVSALTAGNYTFIDRSSIPIPNLFFTPFDLKPAGTTTIGIICKTPGAFVRYTLDGSTPSPTNGTIMNSGLPTLSTNQILRAIAYTPGRANSAIAEITGAGIYGGATPAAGTATNATALEVGAQFRSLVNGTATELRVWRPAGGPTNFNATLWSSGGANLGSVTIKTTTDNAWSGANLGTPVPIAANTTYVVSYTVGANQAYKSIPNGLSAGRTNGPVYFLTTPNGVFNLTGGAFPTSNGNGTDYCADVFLVTTPTAAPVFSPLPGNYLVPQNVTITSATPGAVIYYTTNNTVPTTNSPTLANGGTISIGTTATLRAYAVSTNALDSVVTSGAYQIGPVAGPTSFSWLGNVNTNWDIGTTANWVSNSIASTYTDGSLVTFSNGAINYNVNVAATVTPLAMTVNSSGNYVFRSAGGFAITGSSSLVKSGSGSVIISNANTFTGGTVLNAGELDLGINTALGSGTLTINGGSMNKLVGGRAIPNNVIIAGPCALGGSSATTWTGTWNLNGAVQTITNVSYNGPQGVISNGGLRLTKPAGYQYGFWPSAANTYALGTFLDGPQLDLSSVSSLGTGPLEIVSSSWVVLEAANIDISSRLKIDDGANLSLDTGALADTFTKAWTCDQLGTAALTKLGTGTLTLQAVNTNSGSTTISAGTLALSGTAGLPNTSLISIAGGTTFSVSGLTSTFVLGSSQTLSNNASATGTINGSLNTGAGTVAVSYANGTPSLTVANGMLTLAAGTVFNINNTGPALAGGTTNRIISKGTAGIVAGTAPTAVTVSGGGTAVAASLQIISGELFLVVVPTALSTPPNFSPGGITISGGTVSLVATGAIGTPYRVWGSTNLVATPVLSAWTLLNSGTITASPFTNLDLTATNYPQRFYLFTTP